MRHHFRVAPWFLAIAPLMTNACKSGQNSGVKILNGVVNHTDYPATLGLDLHFKKSHQGLATCTGTVVTSTLVLTAAHCLADDPDDGKVTEVGAWLFGPENKQVKAVSWVSNPQYKQGSKVDMDPFDVAFVKFEPGSIPGAAVATLSAVPADACHGEGVRHDLEGVGVELAAAAEAAPHVDGRSKETLTLGQPSRKASVPAAPGTGACTSRKASPWLESFAAAP